MCILKKLGWEALTIQCRLWAFLPCGFPTRSPSFCAWIHPCSFVYYVTLFSRYSSSQRCKYWNNSVGISVIILNFCEHIEKPRVMTWWYALKSTFHWREEGQPAHCQQALEKLHPEQGRVTGSCCSPAWGTGEGGGVLGPKTKTDIKGSWSPCSSVLLQQQNHSVLSSVPPAIPGWRHPRLDTGDWITPAVPLLPSQTWHAGGWRFTSAESSCPRWVVPAPFTTGSLLPVPGGTRACAAALFEDGRKLMDQKFSPEAAVSLLEQITLYSFQRWVGSPWAGGKHK